jgi:hypothetical protein
MRRSLPWVALIALLVAGCDGGSSSGPEAISFTPPPAPSGQGFIALYAPPVDVGPYPSDLYNPTGGQVGVPAKVTSPLAAALNTLDGFSTTAPISAPFNAPLDATSLVPFNPTSMAPAVASVLVLNVTDPNNVVPLVPGIQYDVKLSTAAGADDAVLEIVPRVPLRPRNRYAFILTSELRNTFGIAAAADQAFAAVRDAHLVGAASVPGHPELDPLFPAITPLIDLAEGLGLTGSSLVAAWTMTTESIGNVLEAVDQTAAAQNALLTGAGLTTHDVNASLPGIADLYVGYLEIPYFGDPQDVLQSFWVTASLAPPTAADPVPIARVPALRIPLLASLPNAMSGKSKPAAGWPVVIYQHGVTDNRLSMIAIADSFASQGFAVVAIDLPLHGITDPTNPFYQGPGNPNNPFGNNERHFFLDNVDASGLPIPDGEIDNGIEIFNVSNPLNARDHVRQANSDLIHLTRTIPTLDFDGDQNPDLDGNRIHMVTMSLGSIFAGVFLGLNTDVTTATLSSPAGPWTSILTDPQAVVFGAPIRTALAAQGLAQGTAIFDNFIRDLQTVLDPADPINYASAASANHPLHVLEVLGDTSVPNGPTDYLASLWGAVSVTGVSPLLTDPGGVRGIVRFSSGGHASLLSPAADPRVTAEMQAEMVTFAATDGATIRVGDASVVQ